MHLALAALAALFTDATSQLGSPQPCGPGETEGCYSNYVVLADLDGDGDLDAVFASGGGYYEPGTAAPMAVYLNDGHAAFKESNATAVGGFTGRLRQVAIGDIDGDGDLDIIAPDGYGMQDDAVFVNDGQKPPTFANQGLARLGTKSRAGAVRLGDLDDDGDLDLVITDWGNAPPDSPGTAHVYLNDGHGMFTELAGAVPQNTSNIGTGPIDADLFDADGDLDLDLILASRQGESLLFLNDGKGKFADANAQLADQPGPYVYGPDECDVDGDGDLDVWLDNGADGLLEQLQINDGHGTFVDETAARVSGNPGADDNEVQCADLDGDGDYDAVIASLSDNERVLTNDGTGHFALRANAFPVVSDSTLGLDLGDLNGDGRLDAITAQGESGAFLNRLYLGTTEQPADTRAPRVRAWKLGDLNGSGQRVVRFAVQDVATSDVGPRLREAHVHIVETSTDVPAKFVGGDIFRALVTPPAQGTQHFTLCATDAAGNAVCGDPHELTSGPNGTPDAGPMPDAGPHPPGGDGGCGCQLGGQAPATPAWFAALGFAAFLLRRRKR